MTGIPTVTDKVCLAYKQGSRDKRHRVVMGKPEEKLPDSIPLEHFNCTPPHTSGSLYKRSIPGVLLEDLILFLKVFLKDRSLEDPSLEVSDDQPKENTLAIKR